MRTILKQLIICFSVMMAPFASALARVTSSYAPPHPTGLGRVAQNVVDVQMGVSDLIQFICLVVGVGLLFGSLLLFRSYWQNPVQMPLSRPIALVVLGLALIGLSFIPISF